MYFAVAFDVWVLCGLGPELLDDSGEFGSGDPGLAGMTRENVS
jgi:hypothetical protein